MGILHYMSCKQNEVKKKKKKLILVVLQDTKGKVASVVRRKGDANLGTRGLYF